jgi:NAD(P)H-hydrate epimerase
MSLPSALYSVAQVRAFDAQAIATQGITGYALMQRAGEAAVRTLRREWPAARRVAVACGSGNNGGDGYVVARLLNASGLAVQLHAAVDPATLRGDARQAFEDCVASGVSVQPDPVPDALACDVIVDALLGTGFRQPLREPFPTIIAAINASGRPILSVDVPSGLDADSGAATDAVHATRTLCFIALKQGLCLERGPELCGDLLFDSLGVQLPGESTERPQWQCLGDVELHTALPPRERSAHKGRFGHVLIVGGGPGMSGAARLAGEASLRVGAGLVSLAMAPVATLATARPELMCHGVADAAALQPLLSRCSVVAVGPGIGQDSWAQGLLAAALVCGKPLVLDADALNLIGPKGLRAVPPRVVLTPHPGEAARLLDCDVAAIQADRRGALQRLCEASAAVVVLKGSGTLVGEGGAVPALCLAGNPGMASGGMGDVLTGAIAGILAQCRDPWLSACAGVLVHGRAGDTLAGLLGKRGLLAGDLAAALTLEVNRGDRL